MSGLVPLVSGLTSQRALRRRSETRPGVAGVLRHRPFCRHARTRSGHPRASAALPCGGHDPACDRHRYRRGRHPASRAVGISERVFADGNADRRVEPAEVDILAWRLRDANVDPVAICLLDACVDGGNEWNRCHAPCPVKTGRTGCKASIRPGYRRIGRVRTRIAARPHPPSFLLRCHPGLDPGSRATGTALARLTWTPDQVRGDKTRGAEIGLAHRRGAGPGSLNRTAAERVRA